jgi:5-methylcytosine-specific restriction endonuclease McrA
MECEVTKTNYLTDEQQKNYDFCKKLEHCDHQSKRLRKFTASNKALSFRMQCLRCGETVETIKRINLPRNVCIDLLEDFDSTLSHSFLKPIWNLRDKLNKKAIDRYDSLRRDAFLKSQNDQKEKYQSYLNSSEWFALRLKVLARCNYMCEGCRSKPAEHVHHLTYAHIYNEFLWELVGVCNGCHKRVHNISKEEGQ